MKSQSSLLDDLKDLARELGFARVGVAPAQPSQEYENLRSWITAGYAGEMDYFRDRLEAYRHPSGVLSGVRSIVVLTYPYPALPEIREVAGQGRLARYAWLDDDYHDRIHRKLKLLKRRLLLKSPEASVRGVVDTAPLLEREVAQLAGLGWRAKNTLMIDRDAGSYVFLACLLVDLELPLDVPFPSDHCGTCRRCLDACPTDAFPQPGVLDATRCISYLTIEHRGPIPTDLRESLGSWLFGCDVCQEVCPWNRQRVLERRDETSAKPAAIHRQSLDLHELFSMDDEQFRTVFRKTPLWRPRRRGILRNAAIVLGNQGSTAALPALARGLNDTESLVRGAAAWALGQIRGGNAAQLLRERESGESDPEVLLEIESALQRIHPS